MKIAQRRWKKPGLCRTVRKSLVATLDFARPFENHHQIKVLARSRPSRFRGEFPLLGGEEAASDEVRHRHAITLGANRNDFPAALFAEAHHSESLLDVQLARAAMRVAPVVIEHSIR